MQDCVGEERVGLQPSPRHCEAHRAFAGSRAEAISKRQMASNKRNHHRLPFGDCFVAPRTKSFTAPRNDGDEDPGASVLFATTGMGCRRPPLVTHHSSPLQHHHPLQQHPSRYLNPLRRYPPRIFRAQERYHTTYILRYACSSQRNMPRYHILKAFM